MCSFEDVFSTEEKGHTKHEATKMTNNTSQSLDLTA